jgi:hypothetical protein
LVLLSVVLATLTYALVENPVRRSGRLQRSWVTAALAALLIAVPLVVAETRTTTSPEGPEFPLRIGAPVAHVQL